jgi:hypothetical protein
VTTRELERVQVHTPSGSFTWVRGPGHATQDVAQNAFNRFWVQYGVYALDDVEVRDPEGHMLFPVLCPGASRMDLCRVLYVSLRAGHGG